MDFQGLIKKRYSVRAYKPDPVDEDKLARILEAAAWRRPRPTASPSASWSSRPRAAKRPGRVYSRDWFTQAPLVLCVCAVPSEAW